MRTANVFLSTLVGLALIFVTAPALAAPVKIRMAWVVPVANWASIVAEKKDLAKHWGKSYELETIRFRGTPPMISALAIGELEVANLAYSTLALAIQNAKLNDLRIISDELRDGAPGYYSHQFFVRKDSGINSVEDLKGKVLATNAGGSGVDIAMKAMLRKHGIDDKRDVTIVEGAFPNMRAMLGDKKVDLIPGVLPFSKDPRLHAFARPLFTQKEAIGTSQFIFWVARAGFIQQHRAAMVDFMEDMLRIIRWFNDPANHDEAVQIAHRLTKAPARVFQAWLFTHADYFRDPDLLPDLDALQHNVDTQRELGFISQKINVRDFADLSVVKEAAARLK